MLAEAVDFEIGDCNDIVAPKRRPAQQCAHAGEQFGENKRFGEIVVSAGLERVDFRSRRVAGGEDKNSGVRVFIPQFFQNLSPVHSWQHQVENDQIVVHARGETPTGRSF